MGKPVATTSLWDLGIALACLALAVWLGILGVWSRPPNHG
jgi:hypothetical protein